MATAFSKHVPVSVTIDDSRLIVNDLVVTGTPMMTVRGHAERRADPDLIVRQMLDRALTRGPATPSSSKKKEREERMSSARERGAGRGRR
jgi:hypothetical protein